MNKAKRRALDRLLLASSFEKEGDEEIFSACVQELGEMPKDQQTIDEAMLCLKEAEGGEVQWELITFIREAPMEMYIRGLVNATDHLSRFGFEWFAVLLMGAINEEPYNQKLITIINASSDKRRESIKKSLYRLKKELDGIAETPQIDEFISKIA